MNPFRHLAQNLRRSIDERPISVLFIILLLALPPLLWLIGSRIDAWQEERVAAALAREQGSFAERVDRAQRDLDQTFGQLGELPALLAAEPRLHKATAATASRADQEAASEALRQLARHFASDEVWLLNANGDIVAATRTGTPLLGSNHGSRTYFQEALAGKSGRHFYVDRQTMLPGYLMAAPVQAQQQIIGIVAIRSGLNTVAARARLHDAFISDEQGVVLLAADDDLLFTSMPNADVFSLSEEDRLARYNRYDFPPVPLTAGPFPDHPEIVLLHGMPQLLATARRPSDHLTLYLYSPLPDLQALPDERLRLFIAALLAGTALTWAVTATILLALHRRRRPLPAPHHRPLKPHH